MRLRRFVLSVLLCLLASAALAQDLPDYDAWRAVVQRAETAIDDNRASVEAMEDLRAQLVEYRQDFLEAQSANAARIETLQAQITALGPLPESGEEAPEIAEQRATLNAELASAQAPVRTAEAAFTQADGLIGEIDGLLRERRADRLTTQGPTPLNPALWPQAYERLNRALGRIKSEVASNIGDPIERAELRGNLPWVLVLTLLGFVLILNGRRWSERAGAYMRSLGWRGSGVWTFFVSLGRIGLPLLGLVVLSRALFATGIVGPRSGDLLAALPRAGFMLLAFWWLSDRVFAKDDSDALLNLRAPRRAEARWYVKALALLLVLFGALSILVGSEPLPEGLLAVLYWPLLLVAGLMFARIGQILRGVEAPDGPDTPEAEPVPRSNTARLARFGGLLMIVIGVLAPVAAALGFENAANAAFFPAVFSAGLLGLVLVLHRLVGDVFIWVTGRGEEGRDALLPVLVGFGLLLAALPFLALIWGARPADLQELWLSFLSGFNVGGVRISPSNFLTFAVVFGVGYTITRVLQSSLRTNVLPKTRIDPGGQNAIVAGLGYIGIFLAALVAITAAGINLSSLAIVAGALSVGIGFGLQNIVSNFVSGIILLIERPISKGDWIAVGGQMGYVRDISVRSTRIETFDRTDVIVPNADLVSGSVTNYTRGNTVGRVIVPVGVAYGTDTKRVEQILREIAEAHPMVVANPAPFIVFQGFGESSLDFEIRAILRDVNWVLSVKSEMNHEIAKRFTEEGIEIPFAQRDLWLRNPESLGPSTPRAFETTVQSAHSSGNQHLDDPDV